MKKPVSYVLGKDGSKIWTYPETTKDKYKFYTLEITPSWKSSLGGNPSAIKVEAEHLDYSTETKKFEYSLIWARYITSDGTSKFGPNVSETNSNITINEINMYLNSDSDTECKIIKEPLESKLDIIKLRISRDYDGVIKIHLTPIMSYGELTHLTRTIVLNLDKIPNGEIDLIEWNYSVTKSIGTIVRDTSSTLHTSEEILTTTKKKNEGAAEIEIKTVNTTTKKKSENPIVSTTYIHNLNFSYGFDSFMYDDQVPDDDNTKRCIKFFDLETINIHLLKHLTPLECASRILKDYVPTHTESIPTGVLYGGSTTVNYILNSSECKLQPNKAYLCIFYVLSKTSLNEVFEFIDYRYLFTNSIFNELFGITRDFNKLYLPIIPTLDIKFNNNNVEQLYEDENGTTNISKLSESINWIGESSKEINKEFKYKCKVNQHLNRIDITYDDGLFTLDYSYDPKNTQLEPTAEFEYTDTSAEGTSDDVIVYSKPITELNNGTDVFEITYKFKSSRNARMENINIGAKFTNLLNVNSSTDLYNIYLSEAAGNDNTMMFENDGIFTAGMHNNGDGSDEWFGEVGTVSEGYTRYSVAYDDSLATNSPEEIDLRFYSNADSISRYDGYHYFLRHGDELIQYPSEKDDSLEALSAYLSQPDVHTFLLTSLSKRGVVPIFFITSGFSNDNADKGLRCVASSVSHIKGASQPGHGYSVSENNDIEAHNFDKDYPYWFLKWYSMNPVGEKSILGTFMIKHINNKGVETYIPTNNYFCLWVDDSGRARANYIEDANKLAYGSLYEEYHSGTPHNYGGAQYMGGRAFDLKYSVADLLATLLALFGVLEKYTSPISVDTNYFTISENDKTNIKQTISSTINYSAVYTVDMDTKRSDINKALKYGDILLSDFYDVMESNNLLLLNDIKLTYVQNFEFSPIKDLVPDFSKDVYLAEISPEGELTYKTMPRMDSSDDLYIWNSEHKRYEPYTLNTGYLMYKYAKFKKLRPCNNNLGTKDNALLTSKGLNPNNYEHEGEELLNDFTKAVFNTDWKQKTKMNLKHSLHKGLYTPSNSKRNGVIDFKFYHVDENDRCELKSLRSITNVASVPRVFDGVPGKIKWVVDPTLRL